MKQTVVIALSGGVDSSVAAHILQEKGYNIIGMTMKLPHIGKDEHGQCCGVDGVQRARKVAGQLKIPFYVVNCEEEFERDVVQYFCSEYRKGRTPNPCIMCNEKLKFDLLLNKAQEVGADYIATGHYARIEYDEKQSLYSLHKGKDTRKDQSYFLFSINQKQLKNILFPLGIYTKDEVRKIAKKRGLITHETAESQEICFISDNDYVNFLKKQESNEGLISGQIKTKDGKIVEKHDGIALYTIGQRRGIGAHGKKTYVVDIISDKNEIIIGGEKELYKTNCIVKNVEWIDGKKHEEKQRVFVRIRYKHVESEAVVIPVSENAVEVIFKEPQRAITPGQAMVFYDRDKVLGGGWTYSIKNDFVA